MSVLIWCNRSFSQWRHSSWGANHFICCPGLHILQRFAVSEVIASAPRISIGLSCLVLYLHVSNFQILFLTLVFHYMPPNIPRPAVCAALLLRGVVRGPWRFVIDVFRKSQRLFVPPPLTKSVAKIKFCFTPGCSDYLTLWHLVICSAFV